MKQHTRKECRQKKGRGREQRHRRLFTSFLLPSSHVRRTNSRPWRPFSEVTDARQSRGAVWNTRSYLFSCIFLVLKWLSKLRARVLFRDLKETPDDTSMLPVNNRPSLKAYRRQQYDCSLPRGAGSVCVCVCVRVDCFGVAMRSGQAGDPQTRLSYVKRF
jgi:hypothetical protein